MSKCLNLTVFYKDRLSIFQLFPFDTYSTEAFGVTGGPYFPNQIAILMNEIDAVENLTNRQLEVLGWLAKGLINREIGNLMSITEDEPCTFLILSGGGF